MPRGTNNNNTKETRNRNVTISDDDDYDNINRQRGGRRNNTSRTAENTTRQPQQQSARKANNSNTAQQNEETQRPRGGRRAGKAAEPAPATATTQPATSGRRSRSAPREERQAATTGRRTATPSAMKRTRSADSSSSVDTHITHCKTEFMKRRGAITGSRGGSSHSNDGHWIQYVITESKRKGESDSLLMWCASDNFQAPNSDGGYYGLQWKDMREPSVHDTVLVHNFPHTTETRWCGRLSAAEKALGKALKAHFLPSAQVLPDGVKRSVFAQLKNPNEAAAGASKNASKSYTAIRERMTEAFSSDERLEILRALFDAADAMHRLHFAHGNINPQNFYLTKADNGSYSAVFGGLPVAKPRSGAQHHAVAPPMTGWARHSLKCVGDATEEDDRWALFLLAFDIATFITAPATRDAQYLPDIPHYFNAVFEEQGISRAMRGLKLEELLIKLCSGEMSLAQLPAPRVSEMFRPLLDALQESVPLRTNTAAAEEQQTKKMASLIAIKGKCPFLFADRADLSNMLYKFVDVALVQACSAEQKNAAEAEFLTELAAMPPQPYYADLTETDHKLVVSFLLQNRRQTAVLQNPSKSSPVSTTIDLSVLKQTNLTPAEALVEVTRTFLGSHVDRTMRNKFMGQLLSGCDSLFRLFSEESQRKGASMNMKRSVLVFPKEEAEEEEQKQETVTATAATTEEEQQQQQMKRLGTASTADSASHIAPSVPRPEKVGDFAEEQ